MKNQPMVREKSIKLKTILIICFIALLICCFLPKYLLERFHPMFPPIADPDQFVQDCCNWMETFRPEGPHEISKMYLKDYYSTDPEVPECIKNLKRKGRVLVYEGYLKINLAPGVDNAPAYVVICSDPDSFPWEDCRFSRDMLGKTDHPQIFKTNI